MAARVGSSSHKAVEQNGFSVDRMVESESTVHHLSLKSHVQNSLPPFTFQGAASRGPFRRGGGGAAHIHTGICGNGA